MFKDKNEERRDSNHARHGNEERLGKSVEDDDREGFFRKIFKDKNEERKDEGHQKPDEREKVGANIEDDKRDGFFRQLFKEKNDEKKEGSTPSKKEEDDKGHKNADDDNFFRRLFKDKNEEKKGIVHDRNEDDKCEEGDKENFFRKLFKDKLEERRTEGPDKNDDYGKGSSGIEEEDNPEFLSFRRLFRVHPEDPKSGHIESSQSNNLSEGSLGSESFFKRLFRDRDRSLEDSEIFGSKMAKEARIWSHVIFLLDTISRVHVIVLYYASFYMLFFTVISFCICPHHPNCGDMHCRNTLVLQESMRSKVGNHHYQLMQ
jgi:phosphatidylinositol 4-kinase B|uniref:Uncharacterized protein n=1 Tax=Zea mays TaxID=4577 RepID=A0A804QRP0_MAIZE